LFVDEAWAYKVAEWKSVWRSTAIAELGAQPWQPADAGDSGRDRARQGGRREHRRFGGAAWSHPSNSGCRSGDKLATLIQIALFAAQHGMHWISLGFPPANHSSKGSDEELNRLGFWIGTGAQSNVDQGPDLAPPPSDLATVRHLGRRVAQVALDLRRGRAIGTNRAPTRDSEPPICHEPEDFPGAEACRIGKTISFLPHRLSAAIGSALPRNWADR
jgi:hypothetical protein